MSKLRITIDLDRSGVSRDEAISIVRRQFFFTPFGFKIEDEKDLERPVLDTTLALERHKQWMSEQPWSGYPDMPADRVVARRKLRGLEYAQWDALAAFMDKERS
jgi:hypothetical protein